MSSFLSQARTRALRPIAAMPRPRLTVVPRLAARAPRVPFVVLVVTLLSAGLVGLLLLNTALQRGAYHTTDLRETAAALAAREQVLELKVATLAEPQRLLEQSVRLGMVKNDSPAFISLADGTIVGKPVPADASDRVEVGHVATAAHETPNKIDPADVGAGTGVSLSTGGITVDKPPRHPERGPDRERDSTDEPATPGGDPR